MLSCNKIKDKVIDFENLNTYPPEILNLLSDYQEFRIIFNDAERFENDYEYAIQEFAKKGRSTLFNDENSMKTFIRRFADSLSDWSFIAYHITRVLDPKDIKLHGLKILDLSNYIKRMRVVFRNHLGYSSVETEKSLALLETKIKEEPIRENTLSFFAPNSRYILRKKSGGYLTLYGSVVGGEIANQAFNGHTQHDDLSRIGKTVIVKARFHIRNLMRETNEFGDTYGFFCFLFYLASQLLYVDSLDPDAYILGQVTANVEPKDIIEIKCYP